MRNVHSNTPPVRNRAPLTARSSSLRFVSAAEHQTGEQYSKTGRTKPWKHLPRSDLSWNTRQDFLKIPSLWEAALEAERRCFSKVNILYICDIQFNHIYIYTHIYIYIYKYHGFASIVYWCYHFLCFFGYSTFWGYTFGQTRVNIVIFITFLVHQVQLQKVHLNGN